MLNQIKAKLEELKITASAWKKDMQPGKTMRELIDLCEQLLQELHAADKIQVREGKTIVLDCAEEEAFPCQDAYKRPDAAEWVRQMNADEMDVRE